MSSGEGGMIVNFFSVSAGQRGVIKTQTRQKKFGCHINIFLSKIFEDVFRI